MKYVGTTVTNHNCIYEEILRLNSGNGCYHSVHSLLSSRLIRNLKIEIYKTIVLPVEITLYKTIILAVWCGCETRSLILREEHR
jgi:hypothetical protein